MSVVHEQLEGSLALERAKDSQLAPQFDPTPMGLIAMAAQRGASIEQMQQLWDLKMKMDAEEAKRAFFEAFTAFKSETITIIRDKENTQYSKGEKKAMYTSLENVVETVTPFLAKHGLSHSWEIDQSNGITVACVLTHIKGHSKSVSMNGPPDDSGAKNKLQQIKSTNTYLKVSTFESICGLASKVGSLNDDGNGASGTREMDADDFTHWESKIAESADLAELDRIYLAACDTAGPDQGAKNSFKTAAGKRYRELGGK